MAALSRAGLGGRGLGAWDLREPASGAPSLTRKEKKRGKEGGGGGGEVTRVLSCLCGDPELPVCLCSLRPSQKTNQTRLKTFIHNT